MPRCFPAQCHLVPAKEGGVRRLQNFKEHFKIKWRRSPAAHRDAVRTALQELEVIGMVTAEVQGYGRQRGHTETYRGAEYQIELHPKIQTGSDFAGRGSSGRGS